jgi:type IV pilus assembly protein PilW
MASETTFVPAARQAGMTLIELMISMALGLLVISGVVGIFLANREANRDMESLARIHENARIAFDLMGRSLREAGGNPCGIHDTEITTAKYIVPAGSAWYSSTTMASALIGGYSNGFIRGMDDGFVVTGAGSITLPAGSTYTLVNVVPPSTALPSPPYLPNTYYERDSIRFLTAGSSEIGSGGVSPIVEIDAGGNLVLQSTDGLDGGSSGGILLACDMKNGTIFTGGTFSGDQYNPPAGINFSGWSTNNAYLSRIVPEFWFIASNERVAPGGRESLSLYRAVGNATGATTVDEIAPDVVSMKLTYLVNGDNAYKDASAVVAAAGTGTNEWANIAAVRIQLTFEQSASEIKGTTSPDPDVVRRTLAQTVTLRGRPLATFTTPPTTPTPTPTPTP